MISTREVALSIYGACQLAKFDRAAFRYFDNTPEAFWRSFYAAALAVPAYVLLVLLNFAENPVNASAARILIVESSAYIIGWVIFPLIMIALTDKLNRFDRYFQFMTAWNWAIVLQVFVFLAISALVAKGTVPPQISGFVSLIAVITILGYQGFIALVGLNIRAPAAIIIVAIDLVVALVLNVITRSLYRGHTGA
ncbi:MAG: hypothetical protein EVA87_09500 [Rhodospirillaceae bacterium]|nr:MAG: hypothetical protein EVA87_09500 [Rhodospirillaceae bacterium]